MKNLEQTQKLGFKLLILLCFDLFVIEPNLLPWCIAARLYALIVSLLLLFLGVKLVLLANWYQVSQLFYQFVSGTESQLRVDFILKRYVRIIAVVELEKHMATTPILGFVLHQFYYGQKSWLVVLLLIHINKVSLCYSASWASQSVCRYNAMERFRLMPRK